MILISAFGKMADDTHLRILKRGHAELKGWRENHPGIHLDCSGANLAGSDFANYDLSYANFSGANLAKFVAPRANLQGPNSTIAI
jgi:uncharacterized protein YjbI with pentapeptide repeats